MKYEIDEQPSRDGTATELDLHTGGKKHVVQKRAGGFSIQPSTFVGSTWLELAHSRNQ